MNRLSLCVLLCAATPSMAETILSEASGNWQPPDMAAYARAVLTQDGEALRLRIYESETPGATDGTLVLDNPAIGTAAMIADGRAWLEFDGTGTLGLMTRGIDGTGLTVTRTAIASTSEGLLVVGYYRGHFSAKAQNSEDELLNCYGTECPTCSLSVMKSDLLLWGERMALPDLRRSDFTLGDWRDAKIAELGLCEIEP
ncbi:hypothetical protein [Frigidibacter sp. SD6-1]|uniref:hypothetical protein n=1 Tax=Frigidibacter sp. SD6-1 TaxID=3032581 RepID=UPI0024E03004|nr:hypothetical protein [Frigidibacter sp. SD6-1]